MHFVLCILLFDFVISVMYLYGVLVDCPVYAWSCVWLTGCVIVLRVGVSDLLFRNPTVFDMFPIELVRFSIFRYPTISTLFLTSETNKARSLLPEDIK
jgi:hypothetical protein